MSGPSEATDHASTEPLRYNFEYERRLRAGFIGCGGHAFRNVYPALRYAPVDLVAVCDIDLERAKTYAREFGAKHAYASHTAMLEQEQLDAVFVVTNYDEQSRPRYPQLACDVMQAGAHAWIEKPPAASVEEIQMMRRIERQTGKFVQVGFKKMFFPAIAKVKAITRQPEFGEVSSIYARYPQTLPAPELRHDRRMMLGFLDHLFHPASIIHLIMGEVGALNYTWEPRSKASVTTLRFRNGGIGTLQLVGGQSGTSPLERLEVIGTGANVVVENGVKLTYYRPGRRGPGGYGRQPDFIGPDESAPIIWEPEFSLGQLYNKGLFLLGYVPEVLAFCESVLSNTPPAKAGLGDALALLRWYEAYSKPEGEWITL
ncbi:MAG TPA: Gfo/Idh/MocA family oxidoreductase [Chloroflexota bacterium]|nr:Gfo/Idh/MocA family oxidoreductase [Chloroflexota bacterium]